MLSFLSWLLEAGLGPAAVAVPVNWATDALAGAAQRWFNRFRRTDDLSRLVREATGVAVAISQDEFDAVRNLLENPRTWRMLGRGTVEDLATWIAACIPPGDGRTDEDTQQAALTIARGLFEFAVADIEPKVFQQVLLARLQRMATDQDTALDRALFGLHYDLIARFTDVMDQLKLVIDRLPPRPVQRSEIMTYLEALIDSVNTDTWPQDQRFGKRTLTPAYIECKLQVTPAGSARERDLDTDDLTQRCQRLVILGGPGSGKTWLAKRTVRRCAQNALEAIRTGSALDKVELPLYTTCSQLFSADGGIRKAVVSSALNELGDPGGSQLNDDLCTFFTERNAPTLLVIDSLDEAHGSDRRLAQADKLPWRIILTSRPGSWNRQLDIREESKFHRVAELQPLRYPDDVEPVIRRWFAEEPGRGEALAAQIAQHPSLQQAATVPLILAFYCIIGGDQLLPEFRRELYTKVLNRLFTGIWRGSDAHPPEPDVRTCLELLRSWSLSGTTYDRLSGVGTWEDDILVESAPEGKAERAVLDHVASPRRFRDVDTYKTARRFIHRSIREHLVAEHVASLPVVQAAEALLPHLWYDPDWEYPASAAIAMHPQHDRLLRDLICRAARSDQIPGDLSAIDARWEFRGLLARVASESTEADWSPELAEIIGRARVELILSVGIRSLEGASWGTSNRQARDALLGRLRSQTDGSPAAELAADIIQLDPTAEDKRHARRALLKLLTDKTASSQAEYAKYMVDGVVQLDPTAEDKQQARQALLKLLSDATSWRAQDLVDRLVRLDPTAEDKQQARQALLKLIAMLPNDDDDDAERLVRGVVLLTPTAEDKHQACQTLLELLVGYTANQQARYLVDAMVQLDPTAEDKQQARRALLKLLAGETRPWLAGEWVWVYGLVQLDPTAEDKRQARQALLNLLAGEAGRRSAESLVGVLVQLDPTIEDKRQARQALLNLLVDAFRWQAEELVDRIVKLDPTAEDKRQARQALLNFLAGEAGRRRPEELVDRIVKLDPTAEDKRQARQALLNFLAGEAGRWSAESLVGALVQLNPTTEDKQQARRALLRLLTAELEGEAQAAAKLVGGLVQLDPTTEDKQQARRALLRLLTAELEGEAQAAAKLVGGLVQLDPTTEDKQQARRALLRLLTAEMAGRMNEGLVGGRVLVDALVQLNPTSEDKQQARQALLTLLPGQTGWVRPGQLVDALIQLDPTAKDKRYARRALLRLATERVGGLVADLIGVLVKLDPPLEDKEQARRVLLRALASDVNSPGGYRSVEWVIKLAVTANDKRQAREAMLEVLADRTSGLHRPDYDLVAGVVRLAETAEDRQQARQALLRLITEGTSDTGTSELRHGLVQLDPTADDRRQVRQALLRLIATGKVTWEEAKRVIDCVIQLAPTTEDRRDAREALLRLLAHEAVGWCAHRLLSGVAQLDPTVDDLSTWRAWVAPPTAELLAAVRRNSPLTDWIEILPSLTSLSNSIS